MEEGRVNRAGLNHVWLLKKEQGRGEDKERRETERQRKNTSKPPRERHKNRENEKQESYELQKTLWRFKKGDGRPFKSLFLPCYGSELKTGLPHAYHRNTCCLWSGFSTLNLCEYQKRSFNLGLQNECPKEDLPNKQVGFARTRTFTWSGSSSSSPTD